MPPLSRETTAGEPVVRDARPEDADAIAAIHVAGWEFAYRGKLPDEVIATRTLENRKAFWRKRLAALGDREAVLVVEEDGRPAGFAHFAPSDEPGADPRSEARWHSLYMDPSAVGRGLAHALRREGGTRLTELGYETFVFWVVAENARAQSWFVGGPSGEERVVEEGRVREVLWRENVAEYCATVDARAPASG
jgi:L-amino acid N-acyltransferase YncA